MIRDAKRVRQAEERDAWLVYLVGLVYLVEPLLRESDELTDNPSKLARFLFRDGG